MKRKHDNDSENTSQRSVWDIIEGSDPKELRAFLSNGAKMKGCFRNNYLSSKGLEPQAEDYDITPIDFAAQLGYWEMVEILLTAGAHPLEYDDAGELLQHSNKAYFLVLASTHEEVKRTMLELYPINDPKVCDNDTVLSYSANVPFEAEIFELLFQNGANPNTRKLRGITAFHSLLNPYYPHSPLKLELVNLFLEHGADPTVQDDEGNTAIHLWAKRDFEGDGLDTRSTEMEIMRTVIAKGCRIDTKNNLGETPLHLATKTSSSTKVVALLALGASPQIKNQDEFLPIHIAAQQCDILSCKALLGACNNGWEVDPNGSTPLLLAFERTMRRRPDAGLEKTLADQEETLTQMSLIFLPKASNILEVLLSHKHYLISYHHPLTRDSKIITPKINHAKWSPNRTILFLHTITALTPEKELPSFYKIASTESFKLDEDTTKIMTQVAGEKYKFYELIPKAEKFITSYFAWELHHHYGIILNPERLACFKTLKDSFLLNNNVALLNQFVLSHGRTKFIDAFFKTGENVPVDIYNEDREITRQYEVSWKVLLEVCYCTQDLPLEILGVLCTKWLDIPEGIFTHYLQNHSNGSSMTRQ